MMIESAPIHHNLVAQSTENVSLSIMILTRNRKAEILKTLQSCVECSLPEKTEFVIVDNASTDGTCEAIQYFFQQNPFDYQYHYLPENIGCAAGRNIGYRCAKGRYIYFLDDDAFIDGPKQHFFGKMINFLAQNRDVFCVTTSIYDTALTGYRSLTSSKETYHGYRKVFTFHGGSVMVDKHRGSNRDQLFLGSEFLGMEEIYPCTKCYINHQCIVEMNDINIIHDPSMTTRYDWKKRIWETYVSASHAKYIFYPTLAYLCVYLFFCLRIIKYLGAKALPEACAKLSQSNRNTVRETTSLRMVVKLVRDFGYKAVL
jgi:glycosyltransferase involved in cell wall biosynthesis